MGLLNRDDLPSDDQLRAVLGNSGPGWPVQRDRPDRDQRASLLRQSLIVAGVGLSSRDERIIQWLSGWEPETVATVADWIARAYVGGQEAGS